MWKKKQITKKICAAENIIFILVTIATKVKNYGGILQQYIQKERDKNKITYEREEDNVEFKALGKQL